MSDSHETMRDPSFVGRLLDEARSGRPFALASVLATRGSMPRHASARMALLSDGTWLGTIGGGRVEQQMQERCRRVLAGEESGRLEWMTHEKTGMACGGDALCGVSLWEPDVAEPLLSELSRRLSSEQPFVIAEGWADPTHVAVRLASISELGDDPAAACDVSAWDEASQTYTEPAGPDPKAYVFGGGHVGRALAPVLASVGFRVVVVDDRPGVAVPEDFPAAEQVTCCDLRDLASGGIKATGRDYVVVTTHGHAWDIDVLEQVAPARPAYVGCIGSRGKAAYARKVLKERGVDPDWVDAIHLPIGEPILAVTPPEIAVSIAAEMIRCRAELRPVRPHSSHSGGRG
ncbi:MAG: XdhC/CoxI family protein [Coriobacteriaceae bacterium]|nr:XdhC family protein [Olsenella sp.]RRF90251.1 MAG: XdhC/CoxI family protein [Coriobacteriaceae bacterium]